MKETLFAIGLMSHHLWKDILVGQFLEKSADNEFYTHKEYVQNDPSSLAYQKLTPMQREIIHILDKYNDRSLHKKFSKKHSVKEFHHSLTKDLLENHIRPFIETCMYSAMEIARDNRIRMFVKEKSNRNVFPEDFIRLEKYPADPVFIFEYEKELTYSLNLIHGENRLVLDKGNIEIVTNAPATLILGNTLYFLNDIDGKKLIPFLQKDKVVVPDQFIRKYFSSFVRSTLRDYHVIAKGFDVREIIPKKRAELSLEIGMNNQPVWIVTLYYQNHKIYPDSRLKRFVDFIPGEGTFEFERYERDWTWEERIEIMLNEVGLATRDRKLYVLNKSLNRDNTNSLYTAINWYNENGSVLLEEGIRIGHRLQENYFIGEVQLETESRQKEDWFDIFGNIRFGEHVFSFLSLRDHILQGLREYKLPGGEIAVLPEEWFARYRFMFDFGKQVGDHLRIHKQHFSQVDESLKAFHPETINQLEKLNELDRLPVMDKPAGMKAELRIYQQEGFSWLYFLQQNGFGGCLADDMGLGKTIQAITLLQQAKEEQISISRDDRQVPGQLSLFGEEKGVSTSLIVVPASLVHNWIREINRFAPKLKVYPYIGNQRNKTLENFSYYDVILSSYHTVRQDIETLSDFRFNYIILDESQMIKNPSSKLYHSLCELQSDHKLALTGTPIENSLTDLWSQINFVNPGLLGNLSFFKKRFVVPIEKKQDTIMEDKLKELINPFILRRTKEEVARELPPTIEEFRYCTMTEEQRRMYEEEKSLTRNAILENLMEEGIEKSALLVLQALTRLRQIANHPRLVEGEYEFESGKFIEVYRDIESVLSENHKLLLFSSFVKHLELFREQLDESGIRYAYLTGSHSQKKRDAAVTMFQQDPGCKVFLISLKAGGVGLNLTAADYVFILDPWWNPASEMQALNRAHRIGQDKNVFVYRFISTDTIEQKIQRLQERKSKLAKTFITSNNPLKNLSRNELLDLFA